MSIRDRRLYLAAAAVFVAVLVLAAYTAQNARRGLRVGIYYGPGVWDDGLESLKIFFEKNGIEYEVFSWEDVVAGCLKGYDVIVVPGGWAWDYRVALGDEGGEAIRRYVEEGGGYLGICAGAYYASRAIVWEGRRYTYSLGLLDVVSSGPKEGFPWPSYGSVRIKLLRYSDLLGTEVLTAFYYGGPEFSPGSGVEVVAVYSDSGMPAIVVGSLGKGRVVLLGVHLEVREETWRLLSLLLEEAAGTPAVNP